MLKGSNILIVDDHPRVLTALKQLLEDEFEIMHILNDPNRIPSLLKNHSMDVILLDMNFSAGVNTGNEGLYWLNKILKIDPEAIVIMITAYGDIDLAVTAMKNGATDFVLKPWDNEKLLATVRTGYQLRRSRKEVTKLKNNQRYLNESYHKLSPKMIGESTSMRKIFELIEKVSKTEANVLITGENGTGKELVAREIHTRSNRSDAIFMHVDMGSITETLFESEMFGHIKGAFTDAKENRQGRFETASGGTLFLDEISNISPYMQSKLLSALQKREITPVGSNKAIPVDIRLISATNKDLNYMIAENLFREDLMFRLNTIEICIPPLREREGDIERLAYHFVSLYGRKYEKPMIRLNSQAIDKLNHYHWPGNVRELQHTVEKAVILIEGNILKPEDFILSHYDFQKVSGSTRQTLTAIEKQAIQNALFNNQGSVLKAARELGLARQTLYNKMGKYDL
jgi:DNA-binding NtrC family response regulator